MALTKHIHADLIHAYAEGAEIEGRYYESYNWELFKHPSFYPDMEYRIKPEPVVDIVLYSIVSECNSDKDYAYVSSAYFGISSEIKIINNRNLKLTFDGVTRKIKSVELINV